MSGSGGDGMHNRFAFLGQESGTFRVRAMRAIAGPPLAPVAALSVVPFAMAGATAAISPVWRLDGLISNLRYATRGEVTQLRARQEGLGRPAASCAAMIPIRKSAA